MGRRGRGGGMGPRGGMGGMRGGRGPRGARGGMGPRGGGPQGREGLGPRAQARLAEAEALRSAGRWAEAAAVYEEMAGIARTKGRKRVASHLSIQASRCHAKAGNGAPAAAAAQAALADAAQDDEGGSGLLGRFGELLGDLRESALGSVADQVEGQVRSLFGGADPNEAAAASATVAAAAAGTAAMSASTPVVRGTLPSQCGTCGGPVQSSKVAWNPDGTADCIYCGVLLTT